MGFRKVKVVGLELLVAGRREEVHYGVCLLLECKVLCFSGVYG